jgi:uncharacterized protein
LTAYKHGFKAVLLALVVSAAALAAPPAGQPQIPQPQGYVNDYAHVLDGQALNRLTALSASLEQATGDEMVFMIMPTIAPFDDFTYGMAVYDQWKIGKKGKDNGLLVLLAMKEHRIRIITGYGLEGILPDGKLGRFRDQYLKPYLKQGQVGQGLYNIGLVIAQTLAKAKNVTLSGQLGQARPVRKKRTGEAAGYLIFFLLIIISGIISSIRNRRLGRRGGMGPYFYGGGFYRGGGGGFGGGFSGFGGGFSGGGGVGGSW